MSKHEKPNEYVNPNEKVTKETDLQNLENAKQAAAQLAASTLSQKEQQIVRHTALHQDATWSKNHPNI